MIYSIIINNEKVGTAAAKLALTLFEYDLRSSKSINVKESLAGDPWPHRRNLPW